ncbi:MAG: hypothetical protein IT221_12290 [Fluviicola sp.]|nr:hypothetical protein [Fluviicola sp.]
MLSILLISCSSDKSNTEIIQITHGTSFGMCDGYCYNRTIYDEKGIIVYKHAWRNEQPDKMDTLSYSHYNWKELKQAVDIDSIKELPSIMGCPDCADGGEEWIEVKTKNHLYKVKFDYNAEIKGIGKVLQLLRKNK